MEKNLSRRGFIGLGALGAAAAASLAACAPQAAGKPDAEASGLASTSADGGETTIPNTGNLEFFPPSGAEVAYIADPIADEDVNTLIATGWTIAASLAAWWKNNSFTQAALAGDALKDEIRAREE